MTSNTNWNKLDFTACSVSAGVDIKQFCDGASVICEIRDGMQPRYNYRSAVTLLTLLQPPTGPCSGTVIDCGAIVWKHFKAVCVPYFMSHRTSLISAWMLLDEICNEVFATLSEVSGKCRRAAIRAEENNFFQIGILKIVRYLKNHGRITGSILRSLLFLRPPSIRKISLKNTGNEVE